MNTDGMDVQRGGVICKLGCDEAQHRLSCIKKLQYHSFTFCTNVTQLVKNILWMYVYLTVLLNYEVLTTFRIYLFLCKQKY